MNDKDTFEKKFKCFVETELNKYISGSDGQWTVKGFIDIFKNVYTISADTKIVSKILEIHLFPKILRFADENGYRVVLTDHQNYYPDISFVDKKNEEIKFAVDLKTTYRNPEKKHLCNGFTLGSHGEYFENRTSTKNIQFPYKSYLGHYCLGIIYDRLDVNKTDEGKTYSLDDLKSITSVVGNFQFFMVEKWEIASDKGGSGNTANIGSIKNIDDIIAGKGMFADLGEKWFDEYWMNYRKIKVKSSNGNFETISSLEDYVKYKKGDINKGERDE